ncbi:hypothetical protein IPJ63_03380 [Candidatus Nomurabacteria bacterium]|nr:MAG: hypothetical protein IPJ63_03380 [Candidatus Nomurabacteria bacterium]
MKKDFRNVFITTCMITWTLFWGGLSYHRYVLVQAEAQHIAQVAEDNRIVLLAIQQENIRKQQLAAEQKRLAAAQVIAKAQTVSAIPTQVYIPPQPQVAQVSQPVYTPPTPVQVVVTKPSRQSRAS